MIRFGAEETRVSYTDLNAYRQDETSDEAKTVRVASSRGGWLGKLSKAGRKERVAIDGTKDRIRNHGLLSKAQRTLDIAGWSKAAQSDVELFRLVDTEGLTPLLSVLNEASLERGARTSAGHVGNADAGAAAVAREMPDLRKA